VNALFALLVPSPRALPVPVVQSAPPVTSNLPTELLVLLAPPVLFLLKHPSKLLIVLPAKKDSSPEMLDLLTAQDALTVLMSKAEPLAFPVTLDSLPSSTPTQPRDAEPALKASLPDLLELLTALSAPLEPTNPAELPATAALKVLTTMLKVVLNVSLVLLVLMVISPVVSVIPNAKPALLVPTLLSPGKFLAQDAPLVPTKRTELAALTVLPVVSLLLELLNAQSAPLVQLLPTLVPLSARSVPLTPMKREELNVLLVPLANGLMMVLPLAILLLKLSLSKD
jgi:hypothetical protein